ncbi:MAG: hypothetical protein JXB47_15195 [Anaerolineae bacterium]|nr:hypothetical protein [Anaerolineae bacterium]
MDTTLLVRALTFYTWVLVSGGVLTVLLIARFFEQTSQQKTRYWLFLVPLGFFALGAWRHIALGRFIGDALGGLLWFVGALVLIVQCLVLYRQMTRG